MESRYIEAGKSDRFLRLPEVLARIPISRSRWYAGVKTGEYPPSVKLSANISAWRKSDIDALVERLAGQPDKAYEAEAQK